MGNLMGLTELKLGTLAMSQAPLAAAAIALLPSLRLLELVGEPVLYLDEPYDELEGIDYGPAMALAQMLPLPRLESLVLWTPLFEDDNPVLCEGLRQMPLLKRLELHGTFVGFESKGIEDLIDAVSQLTALTHLELGYLNCGEDFDDVVTPQLTTLTGLRHLGVSRSYLEDWGSFGACLALLTNLTSLDIGHQGCTEPLSPSRCKQDGGLYFVRP